MLKWFAEFMPCIGFDIYFRQLIDIFVFISPIRSVSEAWRVARHVTCFQDVNSCLFCVVLWRTKKRFFFWLILKISYKHVASVLMKFFECERNLEFAFIALVYLLVMCL